MKTNLCAICQNEVISGKFNHLALGDKCLSFYGLKGVKVNLQQSLSSSAPAANPKFSSMTSGLAMDPQASLQVIRQTYSKTIDAVIQAFPYLGNRTLVDTLTAAELDKVSQYAQFLRARQAVLQIAHSLNQNFKVFLEDKLHEGLTLAEAQIAGVKEFLKIPQYSALEFNEVYTQGEVSQDQINRVIGSFQVASTLIPDKYKIKTPVPTIIIRGEGGVMPAFASAAEKSLIVLNLQKNLITQIAEALHEYLHLIEQFNPEINRETNQFLLTKVPTLRKRTLQQIGEMYKKPYQPSAADVLVYDGPFIDPYVGRTYGELNDKLLKLVTTEVLSVGGEALLLNPTNFSLRDPDHFALIKKVLLGQV